MKILKKALLILLSLAMIFSLFACKCKHEDANNDGICDLCEEKMEAKSDDVLLITQGVANFQFVVETGASSDVIKRVDNTIKTLKKNYDIEVERPART